MLPATIAIAEPTGLASEEARRLLAEHGPNELASARPKGFGSLLLDVVKEPMLLLLLASGVVYLLLGDHFEAIALLCSIGVVIAITLAQEVRSTRALEALHALSAPQARVVRDGVAVRVPGREVVPGDVLRVQEGERVAGDARLVSALNLTVDESILTGESVAVDKRAGAENEAGFLLSGTLVVAGQGEAVVVATGGATALGRIGRALATIDPGKSRLEQETSRVVRLLATIGIGLCVLVVIVYGFTRSDWLEGVLAGLTLAIALVPEEVPILLTVFLALGAFRIAKKQVLARRLPAIESLGSATVLCTDKTGTLTENSMSIAAVDAGNGPVDAAPGALPPGALAVVRGGALASRPDAFDPMELAFLKLAVFERDGLALEREFPLSPARLAVTNVWRHDGGGRLVAAKGAPEAIARLCRLDAGAHDDLLARADRLAADGLRVLAVAQAELPRDANAPDRPEDASLRPLGLVGLADPVRAGVPDAVRTCRDAGVRVVMITGDYPLTARAIARKAGLARPDAVLTGAEVAQLDDPGLAARVEDADVFARIVPDQKLRIVRAFQARGEVVAMTGDGVNDAPALRAADIGIAMGGRGTDVAREAAQLVLLDDEFASIVNALALGRRIWDNLKHAMAYVIAIHVPIAALSLLPVLFGWPLLLLPMHVILIELVIDPACSIVFEAEPGQPDLMRRRPRPPGEPLFGRRLVAFGILSGLGLLAAVLLVRAVTAASGAAEGAVRAATFSTLLLGNLALIWTSRSRSRSLFELLSVPNAALLWVTALAFAALSVALAAPSARRLFRFEPVDPVILAWCVVAGIGCVLWFELLKRTRVGRT